MPGRFLRSLIPTAATLLTHRFILLLLVPAISGLFLALTTERIFEREDRMILGNTAGTLSTILEIGDSRVMIGAGPTRSHAANLLGRSTLPWDRDIDLLILSASDKRHSVGALGLIERDSVLSIVVSGIPEQDQQWTVLEREAQQRGIPLTYLAYGHRISLSKHAELRILIHNSTENEPVARMEAIELRYGDTLTRFGDGISGEQRSHVEIIIDSPSSEFTACESDLAIIPRPFASWQAQSTGASWTATIERDELLTIGVQRDRYRIRESAVRQLDSAQGDC